MTTLTGCIKHFDIGSGAWGLVTDNGLKYELMRGGPQNLYVEGLRVKIKGVIRKDILTTSMIGPVFEVKLFEIL